MLKTYDTLKQIIGEKAAKEIITILVTDFNFYISTEELQILNI